MENKLSFNFIIILLLLSPFFVAIIGEMTLKRAHGALVSEPQNFSTKQGIPQFILENEIQPGERKTYRCALNKSLTYHIYLTGPWIEDVIDRTDYDVYIYNPFSMPWVDFPEARHTEAAGLPEHLGTTENEPLFKPQYTGTYHFGIENDKSDSSGAQAATLMVIEHIDTQTYYKNKLDMRGRDSDGNPTYYSTWVYEFDSDAPQIEVIVEVPETLDMYEVRLFLMADPSKGVGSDLSGVPIPPSNLLKGDILSVKYGGYNLDSKGERGVAFSSCEYYGQDMKLSFNSGSNSNKLYHLVFIAEKGGGKLSFYVKDELIPPTLNVLTRVKETLANEKMLMQVSAVDAESGIDEVRLHYSTDNWKNSKQLVMSPREGQKYEAIIPGMPVGITTQWMIEAFDKARNKAIVEGSYVSKGESHISCEVSPYTVFGNESVTVFGSITPPLSGEDILLRYILGGYEFSKAVITNSSGAFSDSFIPKVDGFWNVNISWSGGDNYLETSYKLGFIMEKKPSSLTIYINDENVFLESTSTITGHLLPLQSGLIIITVTDPDGETIKLDASISSSGDFSASFQPGKVGEWRASASWAGSSLFQGTESNQVFFEVKKGSILQDLDLLIKGGVALIVLLIILIKIVRPLVRQWFQTRGKKQRKKIKKFF